MAPPRTKPLASLSDQDRLGRWIEAPIDAPFDDYWPSTPDRTGYDSFYTAILKNNRVDPAQSLLAVQKLLDAESREGGELEGHEAEVEPSEVEVERDGVEGLRTIRLRAHTLAMLGRAEESAVDYETAMRGFTRLQLADEIVRTGIGFVFTLGQAGRFEEGLEWCERLRGYVRRRPVERARLLGNEATLNIVLRRYDEAAKCSRQSARALKNAGLLLDAAIATYNHGHALLCFGDTARARPILAEAHSVFESHGKTLQLLYTELSLTLVDLVESKWEGVSARLRQIEQRLTELGDDRAVAHLKREQAEYLSMFGLLGPAERMAAASRQSYLDAGIVADAAHVAYLHGRILVAMGRLLDARVLLTSAAEFFASTENETLLQKIQVELARIHSGRGEYARSQELLERQQLKEQQLTGKQRERQPFESSVSSSALLARNLLDTGRTDEAKKVAAATIRKCRHYPDRAEVPGLALLCARASLTSGNTRQARQWLDKAVESFEGMHDDLRSAVPILSSTNVRRRFLDQALLLATKLSPRDSAKRALDIVSRVEALDLQLEREGTRDSSSEWTRSVTELRDQIFASAESVAFANQAIDDAMTRRISERNESARGEQRFRNRFEDWAPKLGNETLVFYHQEGAEWCAYVVAADRRVRRVVLPRAAEALQQTWIPLRMSFERASFLERRRRETFLQTTQELTERRLAELRSALWDPLELTGAGDPSTRDLAGDTDPPRIVLVPHGGLHGLPLDSLVPTSKNEPVVARIPHPGFLREERSVRRKNALVLHDGSSGPAHEARGVARQLRAAGMQVEVATKRSALDGTRRIHLLHVAAHGAYHREKWLMSGIRLKDGWLGFEQLPVRRLPGALLFFSSCESGLNQDGPGAEFGGWGSAGLAAGAREVVLALWKIDDASARSFAKEFYRGWTAGQTAAEAASRARSILKGRGAHPFGWTPFVTLG